MHFCTITFCSYVGGYTGLIWDKKGNSDANLGEKYGMFKENIEREHSENTDLVT